MRNRTKAVIIASLIASFFIGVVFADPSRMNQFTDSIADLSNKIPLTKEVKRVPIAVYDNCKSFVRTDLKSIETTCYGKHFKFTLPTALEQGLQHGEALLDVDSKVYQYDTNDFEIGLFDQVGEKVYKVRLWELP